MNRYVTIGVSNVEFAMSVPFPRDKMSLAALSTVEYFNDPNQWHH